MNFSMQTDNQTTDDNISENLYITKTMSIYICTLTISISMTMSLDELNKRSTSYFIIYIFKYNN